MDDLGDLASDLGFLPHRRSAPMAAPRRNPAAVPSPSPNSAWASAPLFHSHDDAGFADDVFGGPPRPTNASPSPPPPNDNPVYDDGDFDIFGGFSGVETAFSAKFDGASSSSPATAPTNQPSSSPYEDLLGSFAVEEPAVQVDSSAKSQPSNDYSGLDDLLPGFGGATVGSKSRDTEENNNVAHPSTVSSTQSKSAFSEDPFVFLESVTSSTYRSSESSEDMNNPSTSDDRKADNSSPNGEIFDEVDGFDGFVNVKLKSSSGGESVGSSYASRESSKPSSRNKESGSILFDVPTSMSDSHVSANGSRSPNMGSDFVETNTNIGLSSRSDGNNENLDEIWLNVSEIPLFTQPTISPPPARPPPKPLVSSADMNGKKKSHDSVNNPHSSAIDELEEFSIGRHPRPPGDGWSNIPFSDRKKKFHDSVKNPPTSAIDELEEFAIGRHPRPPGDGWSNIPFSEDDSEANFTAAASAAAMKEAMDKAETKLKNAKEVREREEDAKDAKYRDSTQMNGDDKTSHDVSERENRDRHEQLEREQREREEKEKERKRIETEKEQREKARRAVEMVTREARERAAIEARLRAERAAVEKATSEARLRAERAAVQKAAAEARERAAAEARERAAAEAREKALAEARERAAAEAREKAEKSATEARERQARERAAVERATAEVRLRAQAEARERAAAVARERQQKNESSFGMSARPNSAPRQRSTSDHFDSQFQTKSTDAARASVGTASNMRKASSTANIIDDLTSVFGAVASSTEFQEIDGESEERRQARYERDLRTRERAAKALAEKNERDIQAQREQEERHRIAETLDIEIKRWAFGKEGNLRALLSTLQCVLWPECGWQPVSLVDLITAASVKKVYRKATLCIHPDKVQQKGATLQQKYIAEKVFDLLKEAWNKFNSEELF